MITEQTSVPRPLSQPGGGAVREVRPPGETLASLFLGPICVPGWRYSSIPPTGKLYLDFQAAAPPVCIFIIRLMLGANPQGPTFSA